MLLAGPPPCMTRLLKRTGPGRYLAVNAVSQPAGSLATAGSSMRVRSRAAELAVAGERLQADQALQSAVGERIARVAAKAAAARRSMPSNPARARALIAEEIGRASCRERV